VGQARSSDEVTVIVSVFAMLPTAAPTASHRFAALLHVVHVAAALLSSVRHAALFVTSVLAVYLLQPATPIAHLDFWLPSASLLLVVVVWCATQPLRLEAMRETLVTAGLIAGLVLGIGALGITTQLCCVVTRMPPPNILVVAAAVAGGVLTCILVAIVFAGHPARTTWLVFALIALLVAVKLNWPISGADAPQAETASPAPPTFATIQWLGFSYIAFRLIHALRERALGKLPVMSLREFMTYVVFFPAIIAGPIDRVERFLKDLRAPFIFNMSDLVEGGRRLLIGVFKKFVIADALAIIALNDALAVQTQPGLWAWVLLYAYAFRIFFDFSGYTDMAIGLGRLFGIKLPENFNRPYLKPNLTQFWNSWHMTLAQWFRTYYFNPLTRALRMRNIAPPLIIFVTQTTTMLLIGLWHGLTWNFALWGVWHALGLFMHSRWSEFARARFGAQDASKLQWVTHLGGVVLTFHFVAFGWVWFALSNVETSLTFFRRLFGMP